jgi:hypothetical protein
VGEDIKEEEEESKGSSGHNNQNFKNSPVNKDTNQGLLLKSPEPSESELNKTNKKSPVDGNQLLLPVNR